MRILFTCTGSWGTGSFMAVDAIAHELLELGHQVKIFFPDSGVESEDKSYYYSHPEIYEIWRFPIEKNGINISSFPLMIPDPNPRSPNAPTFKELSDEQTQLYIDEFSNNIHRIVDDFKPDIIESQHIWIMGYILFKLGYSYIIGAHMSDQIGYQYDAKMRDYANEAARHANYIFAVSERVKQEIIKLYNLPAEQVVITHNGYDKNLFKPFAVDKQKFLRELNLDIPDDAKIVSFTGKISLTKGIDILLEANRLIGPEHNIHFLIFGSGDINDIIKPNQEKYYGLERFHILGHQLPEKLARAHNISLLNVAPSRIEGFSISCLEAMACGLPVVVTRDTGSEEFAVGRVIDQENPQQLADAILNILSLSVDEYNKLSAESSKKAQEFSWHECVKIRLDYYRNTLKF